MKSILITGCNRGIGLGLVKYLSSENNSIQHIIATCRNPNEASSFPTTGGNGSAPSVARTRHPKLARKATDEVFSDAFFGERRIRFGKPRIVRTKLKKQAEKQVPEEEEN